LERLKYLPKGKTILCSILKVFSNFWYRWRFLLNVLRTA
jgi:hypothetical protein